MINIDTQGNITCNVNDKILIEYELINKNDKLTTKDIVNFYTNIEGEVNKISYTPDGPKLKISMQALKPGNGKYSIEVIKEDGRQEITNMATIIISDKI